MQDIGNALLSWSIKEGRAKSGLRYCNRRRPLMKLCQIQNLPSVLPAALYGDRKMPTCPDSKSSLNRRRAAPHEMAFRHCLSTFVPYPLTALRREGEIVDGLIAGQKRQWRERERERKGRLAELEIRMAAVMAVSFG